ncbi:YtxH domain-containing protein [Phosphitispora fastidiosa]|uniref:YtxH domain-containing protein n=1 Tax=Phosphitispora fastidiosa TaxID=2837202 RepID=UPI001E58DAF4|nr:YtxH domain-containing protein [Phosphitispora fastidiosa]MBU7005627.1 gas vesicle protein [Phosphitispora fastidiosa]
MKKRRKNERKDTAKKVAAGLTVGAAIGAAAGVLLAPKSGQETREDTNKADYGVSYPPQRQMRSSFQIHVI